MEYFKDDKETDCVDIQTESHRYNKNMMLWWILAKKIQRIKDYGEYKI